MLTGKVALIDRGACAVSLKVDAAADAGAIGVIVANSVPGDPPSFSFGGGDNFVPTLIITQADGTAIKTALNSGVVTASVSDAVKKSMAGGVVASSSRGPSYSFSGIKPDIAAPGASVSAIAGSGTGTEAFGGTSGAAPMVSGAAALVLAERGPLSPTVVAGLLVGHAETNVYTNPATMPGRLALITRVGGGEVRVDRAAAATTIATTDGPLGTKIRTCRSASSTSPRRSREPAPHRAEPRLVERDLCARPDLPLRRRPGQRCGHGEGRQALPGGARRIVRARSRWT